MFRLPTIFFVLSICIASVVCQPCCPKNSAYTECGSACAPTCENHNGPPFGCAAVCLKRCQCKKGYLETKNGRCVRPSECPC